jgi:hypothetical protein
MKLKELKEYTKEICNEFDERKVRTVFKEVTPFSFILGVYLSLKNSSVDVSTLNNYFDIVRKIETRFNLKSNFIKSSLVGRSLSFSFEFVNEVVTPLYLSEILIELKEIETILNDSHYEDDYEMEELTFKIGNKDNSEFFIQVDGSNRIQTNLISEIKKHITSINSNLLVYKTQTNNYFRVFLFVFDISYDVIIP